MIYVFFLLMIIGTIFIDLPLAQKIGTIGKSLMIFIAPSISFLIYFSSKNARLLLKRFDVKLFFWYWIVTFLCSLLMLNIYIFATGNVSSIYGQNMFLKLVKASTYNLIFAISYYNFTYILTNLRYRQLSFTFKFTFILLSLAGLIEIYNKDIFNVFHNISVDYDRLRLLTSEPSQAGLLYGIFLGLVLIFNKSIFLKLLLLSLGFIILYFIASKGALLNIVLSIGITYLIGLNFKQKIKTLIIFVPLIFGLAYYFVPIFISSLLNDIENFTSFSTRATGLISAILTLIYYPLGLGYGTYLNFFPDIAERGKEILQNFFPIPLIFSELDTIIATGENIGFKSGFLSQILFNGWWAVLFFMILFILTYKKINFLETNKFNNIVFKVLIVYIALEIITTVDIEVMYAYLIPFALINNYYFQRKDLTI